VEQLRPLQHTWAKRAPPVSKVSCRHGLCGYSPNADVASAGQIGPDNGANFKPVKLRAVFPPVPAMTAPLLRGCVYCFAKSGEAVCCPLAPFRSYDRRGLERVPLRRRIRFLDQRIPRSAEPYA
jgi:hypothetical protein